MNNHNETKNFDPLSGKRVATMFYGDTRTFSQKLTALYLATEYRDDVGYVEMTPQTALDVIGMQGATFETITSSLAASGDWEVLFPPAAARRFTPKFEVSGEDIDDNASERVSRVLAVSKGSPSRRLISAYLAFCFDPVLGYTQISANDVKKVGLNPSTYTRSIPSIAKEGVWRVERENGKAYRFYPLFLDHKGADK